MVFRGLPHSGAGAVVSGSSCRQGLVDDKSRILQSSECLGDGVDLSI